MWWSYEADASYTVEIFGRHGYAATLNSEPQYPACPSNNFAVEGVFRNVRMAPATLDVLMGYLVSFVSYRVVSICLLSVPFTHFLGLYLRFPKHSPHWKYWLFPFKGGNRHIVLQLMSWVSKRKSILCITDNACATRQTYLGSVL